MEQTKISGFPSSGKLNSDDVLVCTLGDRVMKISYGDLKSQVFRDVLNTQIDVGTMAYRQTQEFSLAEHEHPEYNTLSVSPTSGNYQLFRVNGQRVYATKPEGVSKEMEPRIGQMKYVFQKYDSSKSYENIKTLRRGNNFDGWVYADGKAYDYNALGLNSESELTASPVWNVYGKMVQGVAKIIVPSPSFVRAIPEAKWSSESYRIGLPKHVHRVGQINNIGISLNSMETTIPTYETTGAPYYPHQGHDGTENIQVAFTIDPSTVKLPNIQVSQAGNSTEPYPAHFEVRAFVYIGLRTKPNNLK